MDARLNRLRRDLGSGKLGSRPVKFYCPILLIEEEAVLCKGHVVPDGVGGTAWVPQRKDVDNFFGGFVEADYQDGIALREKNSSENTEEFLEYIAQNGLSNKVQLAVNSEEGIWVPANARHGRGGLPETSSRSQRG